MSTSQRRKSTWACSRAAVPWPGPWLTLACLLPIAAAGCNAVPWKQGKTITTSSAADSIDSAVSKTDFHREVSQDQQYNVHLEMGRIYETQGSFEAAVAEYQKALDACADNGLGGAKGIGARKALAHRRMGGAFDRLGRFAQAEAHYRDALKFNPDDPKVWNDSGYSDYLQGRWGDAERNLKMAAKLDPDNPRYQTNLGLTLAAAGKTDEALAALSKAGGSAVGHANLGYILASLGKTDEARKHYQSALKLQPDLAPVRIALATLETKRVQTPPGQKLAAIPGPSAPKTDPVVRRTSIPPPVTSRPAPE